MWRKRHVSFVSYITTNEHTRLLQGYYEFGPIRDQSGKIAEVGCFQAGK